MPPDSSDRQQGDLDTVDVPAFSVDDLTFAVPTLPAGPSHPTRHGDDELDFALAPRLFQERPAHRAHPATPAPGDGASLESHPFVIREPGGAGPATPVDALVVGFPSAAPAPTAPSPAPIAFRVTASTARGGTPATEETLWTQRDAPTVKEEPAKPSLRGWGMRVAPATNDRSAHMTMLRLREEAVHVSWKAAWVAVNAADPSLAKKAPA